MPGISYGWRDAGTAVFGAIAVAVASAAGAAAEGLSVRVSVDGRDVEQSFGEGGTPAILTIPSGAVRFRFGEPASAVSEAFTRTRYRLDGRDLEWRETGADMRLVVVFFDAASDWLAETPFAVRGESREWEGSPAGSPMEVRRQTVVVPGQAAWLAIHLTSAGPPAAVGTLALGGLTVSRVQDTRAVAPPWMDLAATLEGLREPAMPDGTNGWFRTGTRPSMARIVPAAAAPAGRALAIVDEDAHSHAEWQSPRIPVDPASTPTIEIEWHACFSIGLAEISSADYGRLESGSYVLHVRSLTPAGGPAGASRSIPILVMPPFWRRAEFLSACALLLAGTAIAGFRVASVRRTRRELDRLRQERAIEAERARIARDIHDDLGAALTQISMLSQPVADDTDAGEPAANLARINRVGRQTTQAMDEIVWAVNPQNDRLDRMVTYFDAYAQDFLASSGIDFRCDYPDPVPDRPVAAPVRHHLFLAFKEALANAAKHADCRRIRVAMEVRPGGLTWVVDDNGRGLGDAGRPATGDGLANMRRRLEILGGRCGLSEAPGGGTSVTFDLPLDGGSP